MQTKIAWEELPPMPGMNEIRKMGLSVQKTRELRNNIWGLMTAKMEAAKEKMRVQGTLKEKDYPYLVITKESLREVLPEDLKEGLQRALMEKGLALGEEADGDWAICVADHIPEGFTPFTLSDEE